LQTINVGKVNIQHKENKRNTGVGRVEYGGNVEIVVEFGGLEDFKPNVNVEPACGEGEYNP
jgi:hypothetical protein